MQNARTTPPRHEGVLQLHERPLVGPIAGVGKRHAERQDDARQRRMHARLQDAHPEQGADHQIRSAAAHAGQVQGDQGRDA
jgi:hypothetical protein